MQHHRIPTRVLAALVLLAAVVWPLAAADARDLTFFLVSDVHVGMAYKACQPPLTSEDYERHIDATLDVIAAIPGRPWPRDGAFAGLPDAVVAPPEGLIVAGDLTESGTAAQWSGFDRLFPVLGQAPGRFPAYACAGNHDGGSAVGKVRDGLRARNRALRAAHPGMVLSEDDLHTAWTWQGVQFINVNLYPGDGAKEGAKPGSMWDPERSLSFLRARLAALPERDAPVVIVLHFGLESSTWWDDERRQAFYEAIRHSHVIAILHGHTHRISHELFPADRDSARFGAGPRFDCFSAGAFKAESPGEGRPFPGWRHPCECYVFRITPERFIAAHYTGEGAGWNSKDAARLELVKPLLSVAAAP